MNADQHVTEPTSTRELPILTNTRHAKTDPKHPDQNDHDKNKNNDQKPDHKHDNNHRDNTRSNKTKSKTHTHASRSCGARREPWRARSELLRYSPYKINIGQQEDTVNDDLSATCRDALRELQEAQWPTERFAALFLARVQRDLASARVSCPAEIAGEPGVTDPEADYAAWVALMERAERCHRESGLRSVAAGYLDDDSPNPARRLVRSEFASVHADAVARARAAVAAMTGPDAARIAAAHTDVLDRWPADDEGDAAALAARLEP
ncbi:hypothetical protein [Pseudonocardia sp.]|uniref:hypothetical protein n=1 Tax=Pseudonocardia sp. TaxID=60912 RepID=UPI0026286889|nr:hypothetical protein [Pseudonocardia sp.]